MNKKIILTGGAGFIGAHVLRLLNARGQRNIVIADQLGTGLQWKNLVGQHYLDFVPKQNLFQWLQGQEGEIDAIIHLGACSSTTETDADYLMENNFHYTVRLAEYALKHCKRFIYASSAATYGDGQLGFNDDHALLEQYLPLNMYGYSKHLFDLWALRENVLDKLVGLKYFNVYGPYEGHKGNMASAIVRMVSQVLKEGKIVLFGSNAPREYGDGEQKRDFIYAKDAAHMTCAFLDNQLGGIYNIGTAVATTWNQLARAVIAAMRLPAKIEYIAMPANLSKQYQNYTCAVMDKYRTAHQIEQLPLTALNDAVREYVCDYLMER